MSDPEFSVSEFIDTLNQTLEYAYPGAIVVGELANFRVSKGQWVYFDLKDDNASLKCFGTVFQLSGPLEEGMLIRVRGLPRMHALYGFSFNFQTIQPSGEGSLKQAANILEKKLSGEGLFDEQRKRFLPYPPRHIGLITSAQSAAYADFIKILNERWGGIQIDLIDVLVQGEQASASIIEAITEFNQRADSPEVLVITRGGGSADDLWAFSSEPVTRAVAASRIPTLVAIGHEVDVSLAERAADLRASTPSNAAQKLVPDKVEESASLVRSRLRLSLEIGDYLKANREYLINAKERTSRYLNNILKTAIEELEVQAQLLEALSPVAVLKRGYAIIRQSGKLIRSSRELVNDSMIQITLSDGEARAQLKEVKEGGK